MSEFVSLDKLSLKGIPYPNSITPSFFTIHIKFKILYNALDFSSITVLTLTQCNLCLHWHRKRRVFDFTAEQSFIIQLWVQMPGELSLDLQSTIMKFRLRVVEEIQRARAQHPAGELSTDHSLGDDLSGGTGFLLNWSSRRVAALGPVLIQTHGLAVRAQKRKRLLDLCIVQFSADKGLVVFGR